MSLYDIDLNEHVYMAEGTMCIRDMRIKVLVCYRISRYRSWERYFKNNALPLPLYTIKSNDRYRKK